MPAGTVNMGITSTLDILPTFLDFAGADVPGDRVIDGYSLQELLTKNKKSPREIMYYYRDGKLRAVRMGPWKVHYETMPEIEGKKYTKHDPPILYNIEQDPGEQYNIAPKHPDVLTRIKKIVDEHQKAFY